MKKLLFVIAVILLSLRCGTGNYHKLQTGDLVFVGIPQDRNAADTSLDAAISVAIAGKDVSLTYIHTAIVEVANDSVFIIDATLKHGVDRHPLDTFLTDFTLSNGEHPVFLIKRVKGVDAAAAVERAKTYCGRKYDERYLPDNEDVYCTELAQYSFLDKNGEKVFRNAPMNFRAPDGSMPGYWVWLFGQLGMDVPQAVLGTNPELLLQSKLLKTVDVNLVDYVK